MVRVQSFHDRLGLSRAIAGRKIPHDLQLGTQGSPVASRGLTIPRLHLVPEWAPLAQRVATLLSLTLLSARVCGPDSIQVIAPPSASHAAQMAISPTLRTPRLPPSPATAHSAAWVISAKPATHEPAQPATRSQLPGRQPPSPTNPARIT